MDGEIAELPVAATPTLHLLLEEVGGRCELRIASDEVASTYYGEQALTFAPAGTPVAVQAWGARHVRIATLDWRIPEIERFAATSAQVLSCAPARPMFDDEALRVCAAMLAAECETPQNLPEFGAGLARSAVAAAAAALARPVASPGVGLSAEQFGLVSERLERRLDAPVALRDLAKLTDLTPQAFAIAFRQATGVSPQQWQIRTRIHQAQRLMLDAPSRSLTDLAAQLGFADQSHFSRLFKQFTGSTPRDWLRLRS
jgi:AraC-like DNA-binding protein